MENFKNWLLKQAGAAKFAWTIVLVVASLFGYQITQNPVVLNTTGLPNVQARLDLVSNTLKANPNAVDPVWAARVITFSDEAKVILPWIWNFIPAPAPTPVPTPVTPVVPVNPVVPIIPVVPK